MSGSEAQRPGGNGEGTRLVIALAGNPNAGKTTMFNALTGARQHVGNYPGITVEKKEGIALLGNRKVHVVDLPGTYSLTAYSQEELVARTFLAEERPDVVVDVINAGALERNLYLAVQFLEMGAPVLLALNMMDEVTKQGLHIHADRLEQLLGVPVVETVARSGQGVDNLLQRAAVLAEQRKGRPWTPLNISYGPDLDPVLAEMTTRITEHGFLADKYPPRWVALKYLEGDEEIRVLGRKAGKLSEVLEAQAAKVAEHCRATLNTYPEAVIADYRYGFITALIKQGVLTREPLRERIDTSDRLDRVLTHRFLGPLLMVAILFAVYQITFTLGETPMGWMEALFGWLGDTATALLPDGLLRSLVVSGIIDGVGGVMSFVPLILIIFFLIAFLEDSGYMARVAYMLDRVFRIFGLHGSSVMPFVISGGIGGGCAVPGVLATRTLRSPKEKLATMLTAPFLTCGAKLPVFILMAAVFFPEHRAQALFCITMFGWVVALLVAFVLRKTVIRGPATPFVMELPPYRFPTLRGMCIHSWERTWQYIKKAGTVILAISVLLWAAMTFPVLDKEEATAEEVLLYSTAGRMGSFLEPVSSAAGFDWRSNIALIGGFAAKEVIVSTLATAYSLSEDDAEDEERPALQQRLKNDPEWTMQRGLAHIIFILLYAPCFATVVVIRKETGSWGWAGFSMGFNTVLAFGLAVVAYQGWGLLSP